jgi:hypothetical protein
MVIREPFRRQSSSSSSQQLSKDILITNTVAIPVALTCTLLLLLLISVNPIIRATADNSASDITSKSNPAALLPPPPLPSFYSAWTKNSTEIKPGTDAEITAYCRSNSANDDISRQNDMPLNGGWIQIGESKAPLAVLNSYESRDANKGNGWHFDLRNLDNVTTAEVFAQVVCVDESSLSSFMLPPPSQPSPSPTPTKPPIHLLSLKDNYVKTVETTTRRC